MNNKINGVLDAVRQGKIIVIVDDKERENEGDLFVAAERVTPDAINFMVTHGRGLVCMPLSRTRAEELGISLMVPSEKNKEKERCKFGVSIDALDGTTTGISAFDRALTIRKTLQKDARPENFRQPGHVFPLLAEDKGVLVRRGHTEAAVDLARLVGLQPAGVICEILHEDGSMRQGKDIEEFASRHHLLVVRVSDIVRYRLENEKLVGKVADVMLPTVHGEFRLVAYRNNVTGMDELVLLKSDVFGKKDVIVRVHSSCMTSEVFGSLRCDCDEQLQTAMSVIAQAGLGVIIYLQQEGRGIGILNKLKAYELQDKGLDTVDANKTLGLGVDEREYWVAAQILRELGVGSVRLLTNNVGKEEALSGFGITVTERLGLESVPSVHNVQYLETKGKRMGHVLDVMGKGRFI